MGFGGSGRADAPQENQRAQTCIVMALLIGKSANTSDQAKDKAEDKGSFASTPDSSRALTCIV